jgi:hypothetical protein
MGRIAFIETFIVDVIVTSGSVPGSLEGPA